MMSSRTNPPERMEARSFKSSRRCCKPLAPPICATDKVRMKPRISSRDLRGDDIRLRDRLAVKHDRGLHPDPGIARLREIGDDWRQFAQAGFAAIFRFADQRPEDWPAPGASLFGVPPIRNPMTRPSHSRAKSQCNHHAGPDGDWRECRSGCRWRLFVVDHRRAIHTR